MGFESSTFAIDETLNPTKNVPASLIISICIIILSYCGSSLALNLMQPFDEIDPHASYPAAFKTIKPMFIIVSIGPLLSLSGSLFTSIYSTARIVYTMSKDGLLFKFLASISQRTHIPHVATLACGIVSVLLIVVIDINYLIGFTDITGFLTYSTMGFALLIVRYYNDDEHDQKIVDSNVAESSIDNYNLLNDGQPNDQLINDDSDVNSMTNVEPVDSGILAKIRKWKIFRIRENCLFIIIFIFFSNIVYFGLLRYFAIIKTFLILLIIFSNLFFTIILSLFPQTKPPKNLSFKVKQNLYYFHFIYITWKIITNIFFI